MSSFVWHDLFVTAHAVSATGALVAGVVLLLRGRLAVTYLVALGGMGGFLALALVAGWGTFPAGARVAFASLAVLAAAVVAQGVAAVRLRSAHDEAGRRRFVEKLGFTLISLLVGFLVVAALNAAGSVLLAALTGVLTVAVGRHLVARVHRHDVYAPAVA